MVSLSSSPPPFKFHDCDTDLKLFFLFFKRDTEATVAETETLQTGTAFETDGEKQHEEEATSGQLAATGGMHSSAFAPVAVS